VRNALLAVTVQGVVRNIPVVGSAIEWGVEAHRAVHEAINGQRLQL